MPGITGIIRKTPRDGVDRDLNLMTEAMRHEAHYVGGQQVFPELGLHVGWMGHKGSFANCQPIVCHEKNVVLIFQGESFLDGETRDRLRRAGRDVEETSARYLADLYAEFGDEFLRQLNGWFCGVIADLGRKKITLFNDRFAMGRIYYHETSDEFIFASEAKSLLKVSPELRSLDPAGMADFLRYNCVLGNRSLFKGISLLPHASAWEFSDGVSPLKRSYFNYSEWEQQPRLSAAEFFPRFADTVSRVFPAYAGGTARVAFSLTAGLDTRMIMGALRERNRGLPCYTYGGPWRELYDIRTARKLTAVYGQPFSTVKVGEDFLKQFGEFARRAVHVSDGTHDAFGAHDIYFNEVARKTALVRLTGKFGSEVVRIRNLVPSMDYAPGFLRPDMDARVRGLPDFSQVNADAHPLTRVVTEEIPWHEFGRVAVEQSQVVLRTPYMDNELVKLMYQAPPSTRADGNLQELYVKQRSPELATIPTNLGRFAPGGANRLHYGVMWALFKMEYIYLYATPHWMTRVDRTLEGMRLERLFAGRQKWEGYRIWMKTHFAEFIHKTLLDPGACHTDFFERAAVERMLRRHIAGTHNYLDEINRALTVELMCSTLLRP